MRGLSDWTTRERWVVAVIVLVAVAVALAQVNGDDSIGSALVYVAFTLGMVGLVVGAAALSRGSGRRQVASGLSTAQSVMLSAGVIVVIWAVVSSARMDGGFVLAAFVAEVAIGLAYVTAVALAAMAIIRVRNR